MRACSGRSILESPRKEPPEEVVVIKLKRVLVPTDFSDSARHAFV